MAATGLDLPVAGNQRMTLGSFLKSFVLHQRCPIKTENWRGTHGLQKCKPKHDWRSDTVENTAAFVVVFAFILIAGYA
jgi:hypothetical protein